MVCVRYLTFVPLLLATLFAGGGEALAVALARPAPIQPKLAKFEPVQGCYIGAFIERDDRVNGDIEAFEGLTGKKHASYFTYVGYGKPFPSEWVEKVRARHAAPHIAFEPNNGLDEVQDNEYLRAWAHDAAQARCPIFLRWASEMNGPWTNYSKDPEVYKEKFRLVAKIMREEAPNVAMVWTPFAEPQRLIPLYYPGDEWVDWVGVNIYSVYVHDGDPLRKADQEDPIAFLRYIYEQYADRKPIHISEYAATVYCKGTSQSTVDWAIEKMHRFYTGLMQEFPRVKAVNWFCLDTVKSGLANNNYSILSDKRMLEAYTRLVSDNHFLSDVDYSPELTSIRPVRVAQSADAGHPIKPNPAPVRPVTTTVGPNSVALRKGNSNEDELLINSGAVAATINQPFLRGLKNGDVVRGDLMLRVQLPQGLEVRGLIWMIDGRTMALTNTAPYRVSIAAERLPAGPHTAQVIVIARDGNSTQHASPEVQFTLEE